MTANFIAFLALAAPAVGAAINLAMEGRATLRRNVLALLGYYVIGPLLCVACIELTGAQFLIIAIYACPVVGPVIGLALAVAPGARFNSKVSGKCRICGYDLTGNASGRCPECGTEIDWTKQ